MDVPCLCVSLTGIPCVDVQCPNPPPCVAGKYSPDGLNAGGNKACSSCPAGKDKAYIHVYTYIYWCLYLHRRHSRSVNACIFITIALFLSATSVHRSSLTVRGAFCSAQTMPLTLRFSFVTVYAGKYSPSAGARTCTACVAGKHSPTARAASESSCTACVAGKYSTTAGTTACIP